MKKNSFHPLLLLIVCFFIASCSSQKPLKDGSKYRKISDTYRTIRFGNEKNERLFSRATTDRLGGTLIKLYNAVTSGAIPGYREDSMGTMLTKDELANIKAVPVVFTQDEPDDGNPKDTNARASEDPSLIHFHGYNSKEKYFIQRKTGNCAIECLGIAPVFSAERDGFRYANLAIFWIKSADILKVLGKEDYEWFRAFTFRTIPLEQGLLQDGM